ncbi:hypothetical protein CA54_16950 [Symmachiella macrocystis]|uniref:Uncharacterized protein n=1 Tax=Symmachiella macrocystis TaxID=2527985 RepID=A0A5C6BPE2_9PLAN|nr:hypothetical protein [Symmachiella macrocystis]TWU12869.1 hypothetical protein CA54_16950 [Symmachiella macrocystis]
MAVRVRRAWRKNAPWEGSAAEWSAHLEAIADRDPLEWTAADDASLRRALAFVSSRESGRVSDAEGFRLLHAADVAADVLATFCGLAERDLAATGGRQIREVWAVVREVRRNVRELVVTE